MEEEKVNPGDYVLFSYGYEAKLVDFYKVKKVTPKGALVVPVKTTVVITDYLRWEETPTEEECGKPCRMTKCKYGYKIKGNYVAVWDGEPFECFDWH